MPFTPLIAKFHWLFPIAEDEKAAIRALPVRVTDIEADQTITRDGDRPSRACFIVKGMTCCSKIAGSGQRQIVSFNLAGDAPDLQSLHLSVIDMNIETITPCTVGFVDHEALRELCARFPRIAAAFWRETLVDAAIFREWVTNVGQRPAPSRIAHLICELFVRFREVGLANRYSVAFPITQTEIADAVGLSTVHVNRSIQGLRSERLISLAHGTLDILDWQRLQLSADFDPTYLHLNRREHDPRRDT